MKNEKNDMRSRYTRDIVKKSLLSLLRSSPLKNIAVSVLCHEAQITRSTFYNHFYDVYDVYECVETEFFNEIKMRMDGIKAYAFDYSFFNEIIHFISQNKDFAFFIISNVGESSLFKKIIEYVRQKYVTEFIDSNPNLEKSQIEMVFTYMINGSISVLVEWLKGGMIMTPDKMAEQIDRFNSVVVIGLLK